MKIDDRFSPTIAQLARPGSTNTLSILGSGLLAFNKNQKDNELRDIKLQDIQDQRHDDKQLADFASSGKSLRQWQEEGNGFKTSKGVLAANALLKQRAAERLKERKFNLQAGRTALLNKATRKRMNKPSHVSMVPTTTFNPAAFKTDTVTAPQNKTVTVYKDGKPVTYTVKG